MNQIFYLLDVIISVCQKFITYESISNVLIRKQLLNLHHFSFYSNQDELEQCRQSKLISQAIVKFGFFSSSTINSKNISWNFYINCRWNATIAKLEKTDSNEFCPPKW